MRDFISQQLDKEYQMSLMKRLSENPNDYEARAELSRINSPQGMTEIEGIEEGYDAKGNLVRKVRQRQTEKGKRGIDQNYMGQAYARL